MKFVIINESDAPIAKTVSKVNASQELATELLGNLTAGKVARIEVNENDNVRALKRGINTIAKRQAKEVTMWIAEGSLYVRLDSVAAAPSPKKGKAKA